ncbi:MAG: S41 family peptidase [Myxococcales bacterium]|nr:S41 family peptidase [Myxococcales bacterium]
MRIRDLVFFSCGLVCGLYMVRFAFGEDQSLYQSRYKKLDIFASVLSHIENDYVDAVKSKKLIYGAIKGMTDQLDPYTVFIPPKLYQEMKAETSGEYGGPGLELSKKGEETVVIAPVPDSPAQRGGIRAEDRLVQVGKIPTRGHSIFAVRRMLRGRPGTEVILWILRKGWTKPKRFVLIREQIRVLSVEARLLRKGYYYLRIKSFQDRTERQMKDALDRMKRKGPILGLILDMRNNPGGLFDQSVRVADLFVKAGLIVTAKGRNPRKVEREYAHIKGTYGAFPIVCLINGGTASAAEIVAGALQDYRRALVLGTESFGKGSVQTIIDLADGSGLKMTIARYYTPLGRLIHGKRIQPDVEVELAGSTDAQLNEGLRYLQQKQDYQKSLGKGLPASLRTRFPSTTVPTP